MSDNSKTRWPRISDLPEAEREPFKEWLDGQTVPIGDDGDNYYRVDYERWKLIMSAENQIEKPSVRAERALRENHFLVPQSLAPTFMVSKIIAKETFCDTLQARLDEAKRLLERSRCHVELSSDEAAMMQTRKFAEKLFCEIQSFLAKEATK